MIFEPGLEIGQILKNADVMRIFSCGMMGGMRRSKETNTLVMVTDYTKGLYHDKWIGGVLHYTGMGKVGDQDIHWAQNATLADSRYNGVDVHLFEVIDPGEYIYCGRIELVDKPYTETQPDENGIERLVWMFPVRPVPDNDVRKPEGLVFRDMDDYKMNGKNADVEFVKQMKTTRRKNPSSTGSLKGKSVKHKVYGIGKVTNFKEGVLYVTFANGEKRTLKYDICIEKKLIEVYDN